MFGGAFLPKVLFNQRTQLYVMWWTCVTCSVATAPTPTGPWTVVDWNVTYKGTGKPVCRGSINFYIEEATGEGYLIKNWYNTSAHEIVPSPRAHALSAADTSLSPKQKPACHHQQFISTPFYFTPPAGTSQQ